jgi:hypothetical protein
MKNIHILPTSLPSKLGYLTKKGKEVFKDLRFFGRFMPTIMDGENQNVYITSDEEIKEDNWVIKISSLYKGGGIIQKYSFIDSQFEDIIFKKIILTTDDQLIADGVQAIDDEFLEWFVKNPNCERVEVIKEDMFNETYGEIKGDYYKIIIPQEEPKQECTCGVCDNCEEKETTQILKEAKENALKQKTLEEAAISYAVDVNTKMGGNKEAYQNCSRLDFIAGAKWQADRMYTEDDFKLFARQYYRDIKLDKSNLLWDDLADKLLEEFKNK